MRQIQPNMGMPAFNFQNPNPMALSPPPLLPPPPQPKQQQQPNPMASMMNFDPSMLAGLFAPGIEANQLSPGMGAKLVNVPDYGMVGSLNGMLGRV